MRDVLLKQNYLAFFQQIYLKAFYCNSQVGNNRVSIVYQVATQLCKIRFMRNTRNSTLIPQYIADIGLKTFCSKETSHLLFTVIFSSSINIDYGPYKKLDW